MPRTIMVYGDDDGLTPTQVIAAELLSQPGRGGFTMEQVAERANTSARSLARWRREPAFVEYVRRRTMENVMEALPDVLNTLTEKAKSGSSIKSIEVWARIAGLYQPELIVRPAPAEDRSTASIEASIERLSAELGDLENDQEENNE